MAQEQERTRRRPGAVSEPVTASPHVAGQGGVHKIDELLDEIDSVLEENAEEFVKNYVQKGGQ
ncbi:ubiquitin-like protein Pup [Candidatus Spongiisocius sp.]|uniref:ubiquitin-like protein Pup n=1 Tax=Candidatus Spongiisocius sp. TaxID=3101273 RepID=UPI003B5BA495